MTDRVFVHKDVLVLGYGDGCKLCSELYDGHILHHDVQLADKGVSARSKEFKTDFKDKYWNVEQATKAG